CPPPNCPPRFSRFVPPPLRTPPSSRASPRSTPPRCPRGRSCSAWSTGRPSRPSPSTRAPSSPIRSPPPPVSSPCCTSVPTACALRRRATAACATCLPAASLAPGRRGRRFPEKED
ncbi:MAG: hypothetical protein AVDCRST_MAG53-377, partial [uncultured Solirubrobacteraceae bacterium]